MTADRDLIQLTLRDEEWPEDYIDHDRQIVRAIVYDDERYFYFVRVERNDDFGKATLIETSGGGVEPGEDLCAALRRELLEELGAEVEIICKIGVVSDYYNLIHRHNINHYYLCRALSFGSTRMTEDEINSFHLATMKLRCEEAQAEYIRCRSSKLGRLIAGRELPMLQRSVDILSVLDYILHS